MKLTFEAIADLMDSYFNVQSVDIQRGMNPVFYDIPRLYHRGEKLRKDQLYVLDSKDLPENPWVEPGSGIISLGPLNPLFNSLRCSTIIISAPEIAVADVYSIIIDIFWQFREYETSILKMRSRQASPQEFAERTSLMVNDKPVWCVNTNGEAFAAYPPEEDFSIDPSSPEPTPLPLNRRLSNIELLESHTYSSNVYTLTIPVFGSTYTLLCRDIYDNNSPNKILAILIIIESGSPIIKSDYLVLEELANVMAPLFVGNYHDISTRNSAIAATFQAVLDNKPISESIVQREFEIAGIPLSSKFRCLCLRLSGKRSQGILFTMLRDQIAQYIEHAYVALQNDGIAIFLLEKDLSDNGEELEHLFSGLLNNCNYTAGVSVPFSTISHSRYYYEQAKAALEIGSEEDPKSRFHYFSDYAIKYILNNATFSMPADILCHSGMLKLLSHDRENNTDFCQTLKCYLSNAQNATRTAKDLYIHRSSLLYRLEQIEKITGIDFNNYESLLYVMLSLELML